MMTLSMNWKPIITCFANKSKQTEQEISELNGQIAENDAEIKRNVEQKDFSKMEQSALYKEKLQKPSIIPSLPCVAFWK